MARRYFRLQERDDGRWVCRRGLTELDVHQDYDQALDHITQVAGDDRPSQVFVHLLDGQVRPALALD